MNQPDHSLREHSKISPSKLKDLELCPRYEGEENCHPVTEAGTKMHEAMESGQDDGLTDDEKALVKKCRDRMMPWRIGFPVEHREVRLDIMDGIFGTADLVLLNKTGTVARLIDFKFGFHAQEDVETNPAAQAYALGLFLKHNDLNVIHVHYLYPRRDEISECTYTRKDVARIQLRVATIAARVNCAEPEAFPGAHCLYCANKATCKPLHQIALPIAKRYSERKEYELPAEYDPAQITTPDAMGKAFRWADVLIAWGESVKKHALDMRVETGQEIPGTMLRTRAGRKTIANAEMAWAVAKDLGLTEQEFMRTVDVSWTKLGEVVSDKAPRGKKKVALADLESRMMDAGSLMCGAEIQYLQKTKSE